MDPAVTELSTLDETLSALYYADTPGLQRANGEDPKDGRGFVWREIRDKCEVPLGIFSRRCAACSVQRIRDYRCCLDSPPTTLEPKTASRS